jgi:4-carboxymuconolactone decarboxylase
MTRYSILKPETLTPEQRRIREQVTGGPRGRMVPPIEVWLRSPGLAEEAQRLGAYCRYHTALPRRLSELAILLSARHWTAQFEWYAHAAFARDAGLPEDVIEAIRTRREPALSDPDDELVYRVSKSILKKGRLDDALFATATERLGERGLVDLIGILGYYALVSFTLNVFEVPVPEGEPPLDS